MLAQRLRPTMVIDGQRILRVTHPVQSGTRFVSVTFTDGTQARMLWDQCVQVGGPRQIPAGPVSEGWYVRPAPRVRASDGRWRGEGGARWDMMIGTHAAFAAYAA